MMQKEVFDNSWDFKGADTKYYVHGLHSYPAMMIPQVAKRLIDENLRDGEVILDPFCGSGTVLVESMLIGKKSYGIDLNPLAVLIAKTKTQTYDIGELKKTAKNLIEKIRKTKDVETPDFFNIDYWFKPKVIEDLAKIKLHIDGLDESAKPFFTTCFSEAVRKSSNVRQGGFKLHRIAKEDLKEHEPDAVSIFKYRIEKTIPKVEKFQKAVPDSYPEPEVYQEDLRRKTSVPEDSVDLIVTSPPYGDSRTTVAYGQFSRLSLQWLGLEKNKVTSIDKSLLGGRLADEGWDTKSPTLNEFVSKIEKKDEKRADDVLSFYVDLDKCFVELNRLIRKGARICMVVGNRTVKGHQLPTHHILKEIGESRELKHQKTIFRNIPSKRIPLKNSPTNVVGKTSPTMTKEGIVILEKP